MSLIIKQKLENLELEAKEQIVTLDVEVLYFILPARKPLKLPCGVFTPVTRLLILTDQHFSSYANWQPQTFILKVMVTGTIKKNARHWGLHWQLSWSISGRKLPRNKNCNTKMPSLSKTWFGIARLLNAKKLKTGIRKSVIIEVSRNRKICGMLFRNVRKVFENFLRQKNKLGAGQHAGCTYCEQSTDRGAGCGEKLLKSLWTTVYVVIVSNGSRYCQKELLARGPSLATMWASIWRKIFEVKLSADNDMSSEKQKLQYKDTLRVKKWFEKARLFNAKNLNTGIRKGVKIEVRCNRKIWGPLFENVKYTN